MRKSISAAAAVVFAALLPLHAQEFPKAEVFGGFSVFSVANGERETLLGWQSSVSGNLNRYFGLVGDFGGQYKEVFGMRFQAYQFMFGPELKLRTERVTVFVHALGGAAHARFAGDAENGLSLGFGGGLDINMGPALSIRMPQIDYVPTRFGGQWSRNDYRAAVGFVFRLGG